MSLLSLKPTMNRLLKLPLPIILFCAAGTGVAAKPPPKAVIVDGPPKATVVVDSAPKPVIAKSAAKAVSGDRAGKTVSLDNATKSDPFVNTLGMKFVPVPGTKVLFCVHTTRKSDYRAYAKDNHGVDEFWESPEFKGMRVGVEENCPVVNVSWEQAKSFCAWLSKKEGRTYRLPTDHEWSVAVGIGGQENAEEAPASKSGKLAGIYPWGRQWPPPAGAGNFADIAFKDQFSDMSAIPGYNDGHATIAPVMSFEPNALGLYDMAGNVWQWCEDWNDASQKDRVLRGGAWDRDVPEHLLSSYREFDDPGFRNNFSGFRIVVLRDLEKEKTSPQKSSAQSALAPPKYIRAMRGPNLDFGSVFATWLNKANVVDKNSPIPSSSAPQAHEPNQGPSSVQAASKTSPFVNSLGQPFVPAGTAGVLFCQWDTRVKDFFAFVEDSRYDAIGGSEKGMPSFTVERSQDGKGIAWSKAGGSWKDPHFPAGSMQNDEHPVVCVSYLDAEAFCQWLTKKEHSSGSLPAECRYRLPTDEEWSRACGVDEFPWGSHWPPKEGDGNYCGAEAMVGAYAGLRNDLVKEGFQDAFARTSPVGRFKQNSFGLYDMGGNVWQWCATWYRPDMNDEAARLANPRLNEAAGTPEKYRVLRGASWAGSLRLVMRTTYRNHEDPRARRDSYGFRCVVSTGGNPVR